MGFPLGPVEPYKEPSCQGQAALHSEAVRGGSKSQGRSKPLCCAVWSRLPMPGSPKEQQYSWELCCKCLCARTNSWPGVLQEESAGSPSCECHPGEKPQLCQEQVLLLLEADIKKKKLSTQLCFWCVALLRHELNEHRIALVILHSH